MVTRDLFRCGCDECIKESEEDSLRQALSRINEYRALASPSLIALSSSDPILTAFQLSWELRNLAFAEPVNKFPYGLTNLVFSNLCSFRSANLSIWN